MAWARRSPRPNRVTEIKGVLSRHLGPDWESTYIADMDPRSIVTGFKKAARDLKESTRQVYGDVFASAFQEWKHVLRDVQDENPASVTPSQRRRAATTPSTTREGELWIPLPRGTAYVRFQRRCKMTSYKQS
jgi:hypothetical protein